MANNNQNSAAILPLPPLDYDVQYMNNLVRILNFWIQQQQNPGDISAVSLSLTPRTRVSTRTVAPDIVLNTNTDPLYTTAIFKNLPTSATGLKSGQLWNSAGVIHIVP